MFYNDEHLNTFLPLGPPWTLKLQEDFSHPAKPNLLYGLNLGTGEEHDIGVNYCEMDVITFCMPRLGVKISAWAALRTPRGSDTSTWSQVNSFVTSGDPSPGCPYRSVVATTLTLAQL